MYRTQVGAENDGILKQASQRGRPVSNAHIPTVCCPAMPFLYLSQHEHLPTQSHIRTSCASSSSSSSSSSSKSNPNRPRSFPRPLRDHLLVHPPACSIDKPASRLFTLPWAHTYLPRPRRTNVGSQSLAVMPGCHCFRLPAGRVRRTGRDETRRRTDRKTGIEALQGRLLRHVLLIFLFFAGQMMVAMEISRSSRHEFDADRGAEVKACGARLVG
ncbi:uncharacterized protein BKA78DRAFT_326150 [Phyllosticta capitalensis]|uniref:uncharacterized protein n=1 Tax=Phyllosticta capitalensis TaxID=121624 RepID=UPI00312E9DD3